MQNRRGASLSVCLLFNRSQAASGKNTPLALPGSHTPGNQELPRAPRLQDQVAMCSVGSDVAVGCKEAQKPHQAGGPGPGPSLPGQLCSPGWGTGLCGSAGVAHPGVGHLPPRPAGNTLPTGGQQRSSPRNPSLGTVTGLGAPEEGWRLVSRVASAPHPTVVRPVMGKTSGRHRG